MAKEKVEKKESTVIVHFGVQIGHKEYSKEQIEADKDIQSYLLEIGSQAVEVVEG